MPANTTQEKENVITKSPTHIPTENEEDGEMKEDKEEIGSPNRSKTEGDDKPQSPIGSGKLFITEFLV